MSGDPIRRHRDGRPVDVRAVAGDELERADDHRCACDHDDDAGYHDAIHDIEHDVHDSRAEYDFLDNRAALVHYFNIARADHDLTRADNHGCLAAVALSVWRGVLRGLR